MKKEEIIIELLKSLNMGGCCYYQDRVMIAIKQYKQLVEEGIIEMEE